ncbi:AtpZ/AtpI family protein [Patescibacteria group bacterium]|nr:AtpZ/AtpI family protein [Patescibacteria group bacterium]
MKEDKPPQKDIPATWSAIKFAWELGYTITIPLVVFALGGALLDRWLDTKPWLLLTGVVISMIISTVGMYLKAVKIISRGPFSGKNSDIKEKK